MSVTRDNIKKYLMSINQLEGSECSVSEIYRWYVVKEKSLYTQLNCLKTGNKLYTGLFWCPTGEFA